MGAGICPITLCGDPPVHERCRVRSPEQPFRAGGSRIGGVSERSKETVLKTVGPSRVSWVRIPPPPPSRPEGFGPVLLGGTGSVKTPGEVAERSKALAC